MKPRRGWIVATILLFVWSIAIFVWDGIYIEWKGWRFSSRDPFRPLLAAALVVAFAAWKYRREGIRRELAMASAIDIGRWSRPIVVLLSAAVLVTGLVYTTRIAGGADSYGYVSQSKLWANGTLIVAQPIAAKVPWPAADWTFTPLGYRPTADGTAIVPIYAPGLAMLMALFSFIHPDGVFWVVPLAGAALVVASYFLGRTLGGAGAGLVTAALVATSPAILFQLVAPMSDVPVAAFWVSALAVALPNRFGGWFWAGFLSSFAILTRPNTAPLAIVFIAGVILNDGTAEYRAGGFRRMFRNAIAYTAGMMPGVLSVAAIHTALYGSPFESGYGSAAELYSLANLAPNLVRYPSWLVTTETPFICLAIAAPLVLWSSPRGRWLVAMTGLCAAATWACYVFYQPFDVWWYLRFLLTSIPCLAAMAAVAFTRIVKLVAGEWRIPLLVAVVMPLLLWRIDYAIDQRTFNSWRIERRYAETGRVVTDRLESNALLLAWQQSGSLRYYTGRLTLRWDSLDPAWLDRAIESLEAMGYRPYIVLEETEEADFRGRFAARSRLGRLNWPALVELKTQPIVRIYDPDRAER